MPHIHAIVVRYFGNKELDELYASVLIRGLAESLVQIFVPVYLLKLGFSIFDIAAYFIVHFLTIGIVMPFCMKLHEKIGVKKIMALGILGLMAYFYLLYLLGTAGVSYLFVAIIFGVAIALYYSAYHILFTRDLLKQNTGRELSLIHIILLGTAVLGPALGSLVITRISFAYLFLIVGFLLALSILPLFLTADFTRPFRFSMQTLRKADSPAKAVAYQAGGILNVVSAVFWPLFIYVTLGSIFSLGIIVSVAMLFTVVLTLYFGDLADRNNKKSLRIGIFSHAPAWLPRMLWLSPIGMAITHVLGSITGLILDISFGRAMYVKAAASTDLHHYFLFREWNLEIGRGLALIVVLATGSFYALFSLAALAPLAYLRILKDAGTDG